MIETVAKWRQLLPAFEEFVAQARLGKTGLRAFGSNAPISTKKHKSQGKHVHVATNVRMRFSRQAIQGMLPDSREESEKSD